MKHSSVKWIALGTLLVGMASFAAGMAYQINQIKKIEADTLSPDENEASPAETEE